MKIHWEEADIKPGRFICRERNPKIIRPDLGWHLKWTWKIGYLASGNPQRLYSSKGKTAEQIDSERADFCLIAMSDGMVFSVGTKKEIAAVLTDNEMIPCSFDDLTENISYETNNLR